MPYLPDFGPLTTEQRALILSKPIWRMRRFAAMLGWNGLQLDWIRFTSEEAARNNTIPKSLVLAHYLTTEWEFHIQINELPSGQSRFHQASVAPNRYGFKHLGWHKFELFDDDDALTAEADRLRPWLDRQQFRNPKRRAIVKKEHPELLLVTKKRRRGRR